MKKKLLFFLLLFSVFKLQSQITAGYLSDVTEPWFVPGNINAMNSVYGTDWTQYNYDTVNATALFDSNRRFIWIDGSEYNTSKMTAFLAANNVIIENWVNAGGTLLINTATNEVFSPYNVGFGITSTRVLFPNASPADPSDSFFTLSPYLPITTPIYTGGYFAHNFFLGPGLEKKITSSTGEILLAEKKVGGGLVRFSGLTTSLFENTQWAPKPEIMNLLYRMISKVSEGPFITLINPVAIACSRESGSVQFKIGDKETLPSNLIISISSSNQGVIPNASFVLLGTGDTRTLNFTSRAIGTSTITIAVIDQNSNSAFTNFIVTVKDTEVPVVQTQNITVQLDALGKATITESQINNGSTDNCAIDKITLDKKTFDCSNVGANTVRLTVLDINGNSDSKSAVVTVEDKVKPIVVTQDITVQLDASGKATITESQIDNGSTDNCAIATITLDKKDFDCANIGDNTVTLTVTDVNGNSDSKTATVTVEDKVKPIVFTQNITIQLDAFGNAVITEAEIDNGSTDNCTIATITLDKKDFDCTNIGANTVTLTVTDVNGNSDSKTATVTVEDKVKPIVVTQNITIQLDASGKATITAAEINNGSTDNCGIATMTLDKKDFNCSNIGANTVTLTVLDVNGNSDSKTATVTVEDQLKPIVITQNITVQLDALGKATISVTEIDNGSSDNCTIDKITLDKTDFDCSNVGANTVTLTVLDVNGNSDSKTATVTIEDKVKPIVVTQNITVQLDALGKAAITVTEIDNGSTDNCTIDKITLDKTDFNCSNVGANTVTLTVLDVNGNSDSKTATVTIEDKIKPIVITQNITVQLDALGKATITESQIDNGSTDNCTIDKITLDKTDFDCTNVGANTVTLTVLDVNGNSDSKTAIVTIEDQLKPIVVTQNITIQLDALGKATISVTEIDNGSSDNCAIDKITLDKTDFDCSNVGANTVTLTVLDVNGNSDSKTATVTVEDKIKPIVITQNITIQLDALGKAIITESQIDNGSTDNCAIDKITLDKTDFDCSNVGANTVTLTVLDVNGNSDSKTATVTVEDQLKPIVVTQNITIQLDALGKATITPAEIDNGSTDNCAIDKMNLDKTDFDCSNVGANTVTLTVLDVNGNSDSKTAIVTVEDQLKPIIVTQNITVELDALGKATITESQIDNGSTDNCEIATMTLDKTTFDCSNIGDNNVTLNLTDKSGNSTSGTAVVTVKDLIAPTVITQNITVQLDTTGNTVLNPALINNGSTDNCGIAAITLDKTTFDCSNIGDNTVTLTVIDVNGNSASKTATVKVEDQLKPIVITQNITADLDASGNAVITAAEINNGSTDNCAIDKIEINKTSFNCSNIGLNTVTLTVTDVNGNSASKNATVTVRDKINPIVVTQNITVQLDFSGTSTITADQINNGSTDNCAIDQLTLDKTTFNCDNLGDNIVTLTVKDTSGNLSSATATVTVLPLSPPVFSNLTQEFCAIENPVISSIAVNSAYIKWFKDASSSQTLSANTDLTSGIYYAANYNGSCYSDRIAVTIIVNDALAPTGNAIQFMCKEKEATVTDLITNEEEVLWYETATGGFALGSTTLLEDNHKYYASYIGAECESSKRLEVQVVFRYCDVKVYNGISANGDGKNDYFAIEGATTFADNKLEIFNSWGSLVFETANYGNEENLFRGVANKGLGSGKGLLPFGTYYYVFSFTNHDNKRVTKTGFLHLNP
ncbi:gliding motility-associated C-terminal domain-containing protein [Flavobacterium piscisymbiosum]|uniref:Gliding motility-associated C-terminal domain-containing protein n=1 Tax=Flavobacterium piscisymbiosum TaxID=2893753 RepID=A0ABS8MIX8_9FLAO|nr:gliding motility-associated C-terminal domain-containing protein [Flavobacterium sp. F-30]MCC9065442.1 gliding motility-associated C-terminal domain-containing protein [Flavobacterium sp. F-30]